MTRKRKEFSNGGKSSGNIESEIAEEVNHENSFFGKVVSKGEIEELIIPNYHMEKIHNNEK